MSSKWNCFECKPGDFVECVFGQNCAPPSPAAVCCAGRSLSLRAATPFKSQNDTATAKCSTRCFSYNLLNELWWRNYWIICFVCLLPYTITGAHFSSPFALDVVACVWRGQARGIRLAAHCFQILHPYVILHYQQSDWAKANSNGAHKGNHTSLFPEANLFCFTRGFRNNNFLSPFRWCQHVLL